MRIVLACFTICVYGVCVGASLEAELRDIDAAYRKQLDELLVRAQVASSQGVISDIRARFDVIGRGYSKDDTKSARVLDIRGVVQPYVEFWLVERGLKLEDAADRGQVDLQVNGVTWRPTKGEILSLPVDSLIEWKSGGRVNVQSSEAKTGKSRVAFRLTSKTGEKEAFQLRIVYRPSPPEIKGIRE